MGFFKQRKPRGFNHQYIYVDERKERLRTIVGTYHQNIFNSNNGGLYWKDFLIMPDRMVEWNGKISIN